MEHTDILIIGGGIAGLSTAWHAAALHHQRVLVVEREPGLGRQASTQNAAILRTLGPDPVNSELCRRGAAFLRRPPSELTSRTLLDPCGLLLLARGARAHELEEAFEAAGSTAGGERLGAGRVEELAPHFHAESELALWFPEEGRILIHDLLEALGRGAKKAGVELRTRCTVRELMTEDGRVTGAVLDDGVELEAQTTVLAAGGWAGRLGRRAGSRVELRATRRHLLVSRPAAEMDPGWPVVWAEDAGFYCRPERGGLLLCACDEDVVDPDHLATDPRERERIADGAARHLRPAPELTDGDFWCGLRTLSADGRFAVGPDPDLAGLFWVAGLGGHGMGAGAEVGRIAAALLADEPVDEHLARPLDPARLATSVV